MQGQKLCIPFGETFSLRDHRDTVKTGSNKNLMDLLSLFKSKKKIKLCWEVHLKILVDVGHLVTQYHKKENSTVHDSQALTGFSV